MVVMIHTTAYLLNTTPVGSPVFVLSAVLDALSQAAVPLFVMVSGSLLLDEGRPVTIRRAARHYAVPLLGLYAFWSVVFALVNKVLQPLLLEHAAFSAAMLRAFGKACVEGMYHMWYLPMAAVLYLLTPLLRQFVRQDALPLVRWYLLLSGVFQFVLPLPLLLPGAGQSAFAALYTDMHAAPLAAVCGGAGGAGRHGGRHAACLRAAGGGLYRAAGAAAAALLTVQRSGIRLLRLGAARSARRPGADSAVRLYLRRVYPACRAAAALPAGLAVYRPSGGVYRGGVRRCNTAQPDRHAGAAAHPRPAPYGARLRVGCRISTKSPPFCWENHIWPAS